MIETEIRQGTQRRKELQKEAAKNYFSNLGDEDSTHTLINKRREGSQIFDDNQSRCGFPWGGDIFLEKDGLSSSIANKGCRRGDYNRVRLQAGTVDHRRVASDGGICSVGGIQCYN
jgi:hypothetical protein